jgi:dTDP-4-dehydrorhamnose reductase
VIAVTGASGQLGTAFRLLLGERAILLSREDLDLTDLRSIPEVLARLRPTALFNCAAYTDVDGAEQSPDEAFRINALAVEAMATATSRLRIKFVTFSTDYVFDGTNQAGYVEGDMPRPLNEYGNSKLAGERLALAADPSTLVIRTSWLLSGTHPNFAATMIRLARTGPLRVISDQKGCPTLVADLAAGTAAAVGIGVRGILHLANEGVTSWFELARECVALAGLDPERVRPCGSDDYPTLAKRPANSILNSERVGSLGIEPLPHYRAGLARLVDELVSGDLT